MDPFKSIVKSRLAYIRNLTPNYIPRYLTKEGADIEDITLKRALDMEMPLDPEGTPHQIDDSQIEILSSFILLGNAGAGKSYTMRQAYIEAAERYLDDVTQPVPIIVELGRDRATGNNIEEAIQLFHGDIIEKVFKSDRLRVILFIDGLDEVHDMDLRRFSNGLCIFLNKYNKIISKALISCRRSKWEDDFFSAWDRVNTTYHVDYISNYEYKHILSSRDQVENFYKEATESGIRPLLEVAFFGFSLARQFAAGETLPPNRREVLKKKPHERTDLSR